MDPRPLDGPFQNGELMTERDVLQRESLTVFDQKSDEKTELTKHRHREIITSAWLGSTDAIE